MSGEQPLRTEMIFRNRSESPIGRVQVAGYVKDTWRSVSRPMRLLGSYGIVCVIDGSGRYHDALGTDVVIQSGDMILLFPDIAHGYGPTVGSNWSELYAHFDGPVFDVWRQSGLLDPTTPVHRQERPEHWRTELDTLFRNFESDNVGQVLQVTQFLNVLTQMIVTSALVNNEDKAPEWLQTALTLLDTDLGVDIPVGKVAAQANLPYHTFRKRFEHAVGMAPSKYRFMKRMEAACSMLLHTKMPIRDIAESLNFNDEFHFSNRFQLYAGMRPSAYRRESRLSAPSIPNTRHPELVMAQNK